MNSQAIQRTEKAIANGTFQGMVYPFRVYARTTSKPHLEAGADFHLTYSFKTLEAAEKEAKQINEEGFETAVVVGG